MAKNRILVAEDERIVSEDIKLTLQDLGYDVVRVVSKGEEAYQETIELNPDVVLMDIVLGGNISGIEAARKIKAQKNIPIIYLTAYADAPTIREARQTEPFGYIVKPFESRELQSVIEMALYRSEIENTLIENQQWLSTILNSIDDGVIATNQQGKITFLNPNALQMTGWTLKNALNSDFDAIFNLCNKSCLKIIRNFLMNQEQHYDKNWCLNESFLINRENKKIPIECSITPITNSERQVLGIVIVFSDITERKQAERALLESERKYRELVENINEILFTTDETGNITYISSAIKNVSGYFPAEINGQNFNAMLFSEDRQIFNDAFLEASCGNVEPQEFRIVTKDQQIKWIRSSIRPIFREAQFAGIRGMITDLTEKKSAEEEINKLTQFLNTVIESANIWLQALDKEGNVTLWNTAAERISGYTRQEVLGNNHYLNWLYPQNKQRELMISETEKLRQGSELSSDFRTSIMTKSGEIKKISWFARQLTNEEGESIGIVALARDITEQEILEEQLRQSQKMEAVGRLAGGVAHDFNNLLTAIIGNTELALYNSSLEETLKTDLNEIKNAAERAAALTRQLLAFSRKQPIQPKIIDLNTTILNMHQMLTRLIGEDIKLLADLAPDINRIKVDASQIEQVIMNLVINARDAMPSGGELHIRTENIKLNKRNSRCIPYSRPGEFVRLTIQDTGIGMDKEMINQIFEPFFSTKGLGVGTGLGMSVVYGIVKQHEGWINVYSEISEGSKIMIYLPALHYKNEIVQPHIPVDSLIPGKGERILMVEDENAVLKYARRALSENGYQIDSARNAEEAIKIIQKKNIHFDLIFCDVVLPGKSGLEFVEELIEANPELKVLLCSGYTDEKSQWPLIREKGFPFIEKPYKLPELLNTINEIIHPQ